MVSSPGKLLRRRRGQRRKEYGDWANIGADLLEYIQKMLPLPDILRCRFVCRSWRSVTKTHLSYSLKPPPPPSPPLILWKQDFSDDSDSDLSDSDEEGEDDDDDDSDVNWCFIVVKNDGGNLNMTEIPNLEQVMVHYDCVGYSHGYFLFSDNKTLYLFHPTLFSGTLARLPLIRFSESVNHDYYMITKAIFWADPLLSSYGIVVIHKGSKQLLFAKCGAKRFTQLEHQSYMNIASVSYVDIICVRNCIYAITNGSSRSKHFIKAWDCSTSTIEDHGVPKMVLSFKPTFSYGSGSHTDRTTLHLVESQGEILLVAIERSVRDHIKFEGVLSDYNKVERLCKVYKMDFKKKEWVRLSSLGERVLFILPFKSMSLSSQDFPQYESNSVYLWYHVSTPRRLRKFHFCIYNMKYGSMRLMEADSIEVLDSTRSGSPHS